MRVLVLVSVLLLASPLSMANDATQPPPPEVVRAAEERADDDRLICRSEKKTGSNRHTRVCRTVRQMREDREEAQHATNRAPVCMDKKLCAGN